MAVIGATQLEPVNVLGQYVQGLEAGRQTQALRAKEAQDLAAAQREAEFRNFLSRTDLSTPEAQNRLLQFGKPGAELATSMADIASKRATTRKTGLETQQLEIGIADENYGRFQKRIGDLAFGETTPTKQEVLDQVDFMIAQGTIVPAFRDYALNTLSDDPATLQAQLRGQFLSQVPPAERAQLFMPTAGQELVAETTRRGQDITARTAATGQQVTMRGQDIGAETTRRGQDIGAETTRRGQDITMRGQDMTAYFNSPEHKAAVTSAQERAKSDVKFMDEFSSARTTANRTLSLLDTLIGDAQVENGKIVVKEGGRKPMEGFEGAVGAGFGTRFIPGTAAKDFNVAHDQAVGAAFMQAFATLKGGGQITEKEGEKATAALTRMNLAQSEPEYIQAAREFQTEVKKVLEIAGARYSKLNPASAPSDGDWEDL
jgi:hypothetical protein